MSLAINVGDRYASRSYQSDFVAVNPPPFLGKRRCLGVHKRSRRHRLLAHPSWRTPGTASYAKDRWHRCLPDDSAHLVCSPLAGRSRHLFRMFESTLGCWDPASAIWRICPTSFGSGRRAGDERLGPGVRDVRLPLPPGWCATHGVALPDPG